MNVDVCCGLNWGDEAKGKVIAQLAKTGRYQFVCRWAGGHNAGHTVYVKQKKCKTHLIPCGIFYGVPSIIGPDCVVHQSSFEKEIQILNAQGFNTDLVKISPKAQLITDTHIEEDKAQYQSQGSTSTGIAPCYRDKYARKGIQVKDVPFFKKYLWNEVLYGNVLCEGAQGFWLDINQGNYPYVTSSTTLPYGACCLGFPPQCIQTIYGVSKIYDTRSGIDPLFPENLLDDKELALIAEKGHEYGTTTGRRRKVNWLNLDKLIEAIQISGSTIIIISKTDVLEEVKLFKMYNEKQLETYHTLLEMTTVIESTIYIQCPRVKEVIFSNNVETVYGL